jgi:sRNA-binding carbon storage regulator CsrA
VREEMRVGDGERIASLAVAGDEVAFEIHAPQLIRTHDQREWL